MEDPAFEGIAPADPEVLESAHLPHDSMVTVRLSEPPLLTVITQSIPISDDQEDGSREGMPFRTPDSDVDYEEDLRTALPNEHPIADARKINSIDSVQGSVDERISIDANERRGSDSTEDSGDGEVNWAELEKTEEQEPRDQDSEDSTALLLARLEQENNLLATNPKSGIVPIARMRTTGSQSRPPSMQQLKKMVNGPTPPALRYSLIPAPPMTDLEFYTALVQDYSRTAQCLPTLLSRKVRNGVPPPLRGVVWQSMSGARDRLLEDQFDRLCGESSPYEGMIGKDIGRSFPGVEMFRDPEGDGQRMLGRVLKCFSLYDHKIGYCQGLGFLVGPLLMHMGDKQAFCVLVRLMEHYDLRSCFLPDLSGLHVRIYQFRELLKKHLPTLTAHLEVLQIEPTYVSQWFLSFFAVTCPLPMLFRIYDVIFAEGASETIMRVALSVMRKNEEKILACTEFEDIMQLLLSRGLWDCYHYNADDFVNDFVSLTSVVTNESLQALKESYIESRALDATVSPSSDVGSAASRFLGRLWSASSTSTPKSATLSPGLSAPSRPASSLRRSTSKQSIASTLNSTECGSDTTASSTLTDVTMTSRDSSNTDGSFTRAQSTRFTNIVAPTVKLTSNDKNLHGQIEDLLTALSELQRDHAILATQMQREIEERDEDRHAVRSLLDGLRNRAVSETLNIAGSEGSLETVTHFEEADSEITHDHPESGIVAEVLHEGEITVVREDLDDAVHVAEISRDDLLRLLESVEERFAKSTDRRSSILQSKSQLRDELVRSKEQLVIEISKSQELSRRLTEMEQESLGLKEQLKEGHNHIRNAHQEKQRLEKQVHDLRSKKTPIASPAASTTSENDWPKRGSGHAGLRELRLGRTNSSSSQGPTFSKRTSSLNTQVPNVKENDSPISFSEASFTPPGTDVDALVLELVQAKTAKAIAEQEAEEAKAKLETFRRLVGLSNTDSMGHKSSPSQPNIEKSVTFNAFSSYMSRPSDSRVASPPAATPSSSTSSGGFWGGWGKRTVSTEKVAAAQERA